MSFVKGYLIPRLIQYVLVIFLGLTAVFIIPRLTPSDPVNRTIIQLRSMGSYLDPGSMNAFIEDLTELYGLTGSPLEQYGGDSFHTDARADIYAFGATLYHLLTNTTPINVRDRFLDPKNLPNPRAINPAVSPRVAEAILWAMELHPDNRPQNVNAFIKALTGESTDSLLKFSGKSQYIPKPRFGTAEVRLGIAASALVFLSLLLTLLRNL